MISKETKSLIIKNFAKSANDVGSCEVQIALLSERIKRIAEHLKKAKKDFHSQRGLLLLVGRRRTFLGYLKKNDPKGYESLIQSLKIHG